MDIIKTYILKAGESYNYLKKRYLSENPKENEVSFINFLIDQLNDQKETLSNFNYDKFIKDEIKKRPYLSNGKESNSDNIQEWKRQEIEYPKNIYEKKVRDLNILISKLKVSNSDNIQEWKRQKIEYQKNINEKKVRDLNILISNLKEKLSEFERLAKKEKEKELELLQRLKEQLIKSEPKEYDYKYPKVFKKKEAELIFMDYIKNHLIDPYTDLSFIYQQLKEADLVEHFNHLEFAKWMKDEKLISERTYDGILDKRGFKSLNKSTSSNRLKDYYLITNRYIKSKSEK